MKKYLFLSALLFFVACEEKATPRVTMDSSLALPITCMKLNTLSSDIELLEGLKKLYAFDDNCSLVLTLSSKKDIVCNSPQNAMAKASGKFPKSYLKLKLRKGMALQYSYYVDLYSNVEEDDVEEGFKRLKKDLIGSKGEE